MYVERAPIHLYANMQKFTNTIATQILYVEQSISDLNIDLEVKVTIKSKLQVNQFKFARS